MTLVNLYNYASRRNGVPFFKDWGRTMDSSVQQGDGTVFLPPLNISESDDAFHIYLSVPGYAKESIKLQQEKKLLTISSEGPNVSGNRRYIRKEFSLGGFKRAFNLPDSVDVNNISASFKNGVLAITLSKKEEAKPSPARIIEIE